LIWDGYATEMKVTWTRSYSDGQSYDTLVERPFYFHDPPVIRDMYPMKGPAQGGTQVSVRGVMPYSNNSIVLGADKVSHHYYSLGLEHIEAITPLVKFELIKRVTAKDPVGFEFNRAEYDVTYMEPDSISAGATTVQTPPQVLNETDATAEYNVYVSYNRQLWYPLTTSTQRFVFYDYSRMAYGNVIAMSPMRERRLPMFDSSKSRRPTQVLQTATQSSRTDVEPY